jgi:hypothetical protein
MTVFPICPASRSLRAVPGIPGAGPLEAGRLYAF